MKTTEIRDLAIERHNIDADFFQKTYSDVITANKAYPFKYGRNLVLEDLNQILSSLPANAKVLDIGSGTGHLTNWIASKNFDVVGMEPSANMIGFAKKNFPNIKFVEGISSALPFQENQFDLVIAFEVFRYLDKAENIKTFAEVHKVLKPGGTFFFTQVNKYATDYYYPFFYLKKVVYSVLKKTYHYCFFTTPSEQQKLLKEAGFKEINAYGRMAASIRLAYKFGKGAGDSYTKLMEKIFGKQKFEKQPYKAFGGHLVVVAKK
jgi:2-polyprenyl-3-methyl-5-hydroxy-6-metoxy-1,4-benzoquinol methylase